MRRSENPFESLYDLAVYNSRDWSLDPADAWFYGIVVGWDEVLPDVARKHGWDDEAQARLRVLGLKWDHAARREAEEEGT